MDILEIQKILKKKTDKKVQASWQKFIPTLKKVYGVKVPVLNEIAKKVTGPNFSLIEKLWQSEMLEEKLLAAKILGRICQKQPDKTLKLIKKFSRDITDWAVCDTLATQGIRKIAKTKQKEIFALAKILVASKNLWQRRFGLVLLINFTKDNGLKNDIEKIIKTVENDKEYYVKKAVVWLKSRLK